MAQPIEFKQYEAELTSNIISEKSRFEKVFNNLAKNYFPKEAAAVFPGRFLQLVEPQLKDVVCKYGSDIYDKMISTDPVIEQMTGFLLKSISTFTSEPVVSGDDWQHKFLTKFLKRALDYVVDLDDFEAKMNYDLVRYGVSYGSIGYERRDIFGLNALVPVNLDDICLKDILEVRDNRGRILGYVPTGGVFTRHFSSSSAIDFDLLVEGVARTTVTIDELARLFNTLPMEAPEVVQIIENINFIAKDKVLNFRYLPTSDSYSGSKGTLDSVIHHWWIRQQILAVILYHVQNFSLPVRHGALGANVKTVNLVDDQGNPIIENDIAVSIDAKVDYEGSIAKSKNGGILITPSGYLYSLVQADEKMLIALWKLYNDIGYEIQKAILLQTASTSAESTGTNSDSQKPILYLNVHYLKHRKRVTFKKFYKTIVTLNFPDWGFYTPNVHTGSLNGMPHDLTEIGVLNQSNFFTAHQKEELSRELNFPV